MNEDFYDKIEKAIRNKDHDCLERIGRICPFHKFEIVIRYFMNVAAECGNIEVLKGLVARYPEYFIIAENYPLKLAVQNKHEECVNFLLENRCVLFFDV